MNGRPSYYKNSRLLHSLALAAAGNERDALVREEDYNAAIGELLMRMGEEHFSGRFLSKILNWFGLEHKVERKTLEKIFTRDGPYLSRLYSMFSQTEIRSLLTELDRLFLDEQDSIVKADLSRIRDLLESKDLLLGVALFVEEIVYRMQRIEPKWFEPCEPDAEAYHLPSGAPVSWVPFCVCEAVIYRIGAVSYFLSPAFLNELQQVGLIGVVPYYMFSVTRITRGRADLLGEAYRSWLIHMTSPDPDSDPVTGSIRVALLSNMKAAYDGQRESVRSAIVPLLSLIALKGRGENGHEEILKLIQTWLPHDQLFKFMSELIDDSMTQEILRFPVSDTELDESSAQISSRDVAQIRDQFNAVLWVFLFASRDIEAYWRLALAAVNTFCSLMLGLYGIAA